MPGSVTSLSSSSLKKLGKLVAKANVHTPQTKKEETELIKNLQFAQHLSTNQRMLIAKLLFIVDEEDEADRLCRQEELDIDDAETLVTEVLSEEGDDDYEPSFIDDEDEEVGSQISSLTASTLASDNGERGQMFSKKCKR